MAVALQEDWGASSGRSAIAIACRPSWQFLRSKTRSGRLIDGPSRQWSVHHFKNEGLHPDVPEEHKRLRRAEPTGAANLSKQTAAMLASPFGIVT